MKIMSTTETDKEKKRVTYFGMKVTIRERESIHALAKVKGKSAKKVIMELVQNDLKNNVDSLPQRRATAKEIGLLSPEQRKKFLENEAKAISKDFEVIEDGFDIVED